MIKRLLLFLLPCLLAGTAMAQTETEASLKAVFIYNFTKYIEWDSSTQNTDFVIGIIGSSGVTSSLREIARTNTAKNRQMIVKVFNRPEDISGCQVLFIPQNCPYSLRSVLSKAGKGVLTVSEKEGFASRGAALNFVVVNDKLKFEANLDAIYSAGLKAGSQLLKLAIIVD